MARYVVLSFEDNADADSFLQHDNLEHVEGSWKVEGLFAKPTMFCESSGSGGCRTGKRFSSWFRGAKYGWWVCVGCGRPTSLASDEQRMRACVGQGVNLLPDAEDVPNNPLEPV